MNVHKTPEEIEQDEQELPIWFEIVGSVLALLAAVVAALYLL